MEDLIQFFFRTPAPYFVIVHLTAALQIETSEVLMVRQTLLQALDDGDGGGNLWQPLAPHQPASGTIISGGDEEVNRALYQLLWKPKIGVEVRIQAAHLDKR